MIRVQSLGQWPVSGIVYCKNLKDTLPWWMFLLKVTQRRFFYLGVGLVGPGYPFSVKWYNSISTWRVLTSCLCSNSLPSSPIMTASSNQFIKHHTLSVQVMKRWQVKSGLLWLRAATQVSTPWLARELLGRKWALIAEGKWDDLTARFAVVAKAINMASFICTSSLTRDTALSRSAKAKTGLSPAQLHSTAVAIGGDARACQGLSLGDTFGVCQWTQRCIRTK